MPPVSLNKRLHTRRVNSNVATECQRSMVLGQKRDMNIWQVLCQKKKNPREEPPLVRSSSRLCLFNLSSSQKISTPSMDRLDRFDDDNSSVDSSDAQSHRQFLSSENNSSLWSADGMSVDKEDFEDGRKLQAFPTSRLRRCTTDLPFMHTRSNTSQGKEMEVEERDEDGLYFFSDCGVSAASTMENDDDGEHVWGHFVDVLQSSAKPSSKSNICNRLNTEPYDVSKAPALRRQNCAMMHLSDFLSFA